MTPASTSASSTWSGKRAMSGHSKWSSIKHKKGAADAKRGKLFSKLTRAIIRGSGAGADTETFEHIVYEGYGPNGVAIIAEALTDNRNRTASDVRHVFTKNEGNLGTTGAVAWLFERRGIVMVDADRADEDSVMLAAAEGGAEDVTQDGDSFEVTTSPEALS